MAKKTVEETCDLCDKPPDHEHKPPFVCFVCKTKYDLPPEAVACRASH